MVSADSLSTSTSLINQVRAGEQLAWNRFVSLYTPLILNWCHRYGIRGTDADDIAQNVFLAILKHIAEFGKDHLDNSFRAWLWTITRSKILDELRYTKKYPRAVGGQTLSHLDVSWPTPIESRSSSESAQDLELLIAVALQIIRQDFSMQTWQAFWQSAALGQRPSEVARELGMTAAAICMCRARVLRRLRETIEEL